MVVSVSTTTKASSHDELTTMIANRDDEKLAVIGIAAQAQVLVYITTCGLKEEDFRYDKVAHPFFS